jgi:hypothetical protein
MGLWAPKLTRIRTLVVGSVLALALLAAVAPNQAHASPFTFCNGVGLGIGFPADRCVHGVSRQYSLVRVSSSGTTTKCAIVKQLSTGGGNNNTAPGCAFSSGFVYSYCSVPYSCTGYPTITNDGVATGYVYNGYGDF